METKDGTYHDVIGGLGKAERKAVIEGRNGPPWRPELAFDSRCLPRDQQLPAAVSTQVSIGRIYTRSLHQAICWKKEAGPLVNVATRGIPKQLSRNAYAA